jgi:transcriptional regulator with XRE-family HTH domain
MPSAASPAVVPERWVSKSETLAEIDFSLLLSPDLMELAQHIDAVRMVLRKADEHNEAWRSEVVRMIEALVGDAAEALGRTTSEAPAEALGAPFLNADYLGWQHPDTYYFGDFTLAAANVTNRYYYWYPYLYPLNEYGSLNNPYVAPTASDNWVEDYISDPVVHTAKESPALAAFNRLRHALSLTDEETARVVGIGRTTFYSWQRGTDPRSSTIRELYELDALVVSLLRAIGDAGLQDLLHLRQSSGQTLHELIRDGHTEELRDRARAAIFSRSTGPVARSLLPEVAVEIVSDSALKPIRRRRARRRK